MKSIRPLLVVAAITAGAVSARPAMAGTGCQDDPERCVERGATTSHRTVAVSPAPTVAAATVAPVRIAPVSAAHKLAPAQHKNTTKPARVAPSTPAPATPGMGMLLKLSNGGGGDVSLFPSRPSDSNTGASWVL